MRSLHDEHDAWWNSEAATALASEVMRAIERAVIPHRMHVTFSGTDRFEIAVRDAHLRAIVDRPQPLAG